MVQAYIKIDQHTNRVLNVVKAKFNLKDKSAAIEKIVSVYENDYESLELRPEYIKYLDEIEKDEPIKIPDGMSLLEYIDGLTDEDDEDE